MDFIRRRICFLLAVLLLLGLRTPMYITAGAYNGNTDSELETAAALTSNVRSASEDVPTLDGSYQCMEGESLVLRIERITEFLSCTWSCSDEAAVDFIDRNGTSSANMQIIARKAGTYEITAKIIDFTEEYTLTTTLTVEAAPDVSFAKAQYSHMLGQSGTFSVAYTYSQPIDSVEWILSNSAAVEFTGETSILSTNTPDTPAGQYCYAISIPYTCVTEGDHSVTVQIRAGERTFQKTVPLNIRIMLRAGTLEYLGDLLTEESRIATIDGTDYEIGQTCNISQVNTAYHSGRCSAVVFALGEEDEITQISPADLVVTPKVTLKLDSDGFVYHNGQWNTDTVDAVASVSWSRLSTSPFSSGSLLSSGLSFILNEISLTLDSDGLHFGTTGGLLSKEIKKSSESGISISYGGATELSFPIYLKENYNLSEIVTYDSVSAQVTAPWSAEPVQCRPVTISLGNLDLQEEQAAAARQSRKTAQSSNEANEKLDLMQDRSILSHCIDLANWFTAEQYEQIERFLLLYLSVLYGVEDDSWLNDLDEGLQDEVKGRVRKYLGVENMYDDYMKHTLGVQYNTMHAAVEYRGKDKNGEDVTITFSFALPYAEGKGGVFGSTGSINFTIDGEMPDGAFTDHGLMMLTYVDFDAFSDVVLTYVNQAYMQMWGKSADKIAKMFVSDLFDTVMGGSYADRVYNAYTGWFRGQMDKYTINCPVDVYVFDMTGQQVGSIIGNEVDSGCTDILMAVNGDSKVVWFSGDSYSLKLVGSDEGTMDYIIEEYADEVLKRTVSFQDVPLTDGKTYHALAPVYEEVPCEVFALETEVEEQITPDSDSAEITTDETIEVLKKGYCTSTIQYRLYSNGVLVVSGTGPLDGNTEMQSDPLPFASENIEYVIIEEGITRIGSYAFSENKYYGHYATWNDNIRSVLIPDSVTEISSRAFYDAIGLQDLYIGSGVSSIGEWAFSYCRSLMSICISEENPYFNVKDNILFSEDGTYVHLASRIGTTEYTIPDGVKVIGPDAFGDSQSLKKIVFPASVEMIEESAFDACTALKSIHFLGDPPQIDSAAFAGVTADVYYPGINDLWLRKYQSNYGGTLTWHTDDGSPGTNLHDRGVYGSNIFWELTTDDELIVYGDGAMVEDAEIPWMGYRTVIRTLTIGEGITRLCEGAFANFYNLERINFNAVAMEDTEKGNTTFSRCGSGSKSVALTIGAGVTKIPANLFYTEYSSMSPTAPRIQTVIFEDGSVCKRIGDHAFYQCEYLESVQLPEGLEEIGDYAFYGCSAIEEVSVPNTVHTLGAFVFSQCSSLMAIDLPDHVDELGEFAFWDCVALRTIDLPDGITVLREYTFSGCESLTEIRIPDSVTEIWNYVFEDCKSLTEFVVPKQIKRIEDGVFAGCSGLTAFKVEEGNESFCAIAGVLYQTEKRWLKAVPGGLSGRFIIPDHVDYIANDAFNGCSQITEIIIPQEVRSIGSYVFSNCTGLRECMIPSTVTRMGSRVFFKCSNLERVALPSSITEIGFGLFQDCINLKEVIIPAKVSCIDWVAFSRCTSLKDIIFMGDAPEKFANSAFEDTQLTAYYDADNETWTEDLFKDYGGTITWHPYSKKEETTGTFGQNLTWRYEPDTGLLSISGEGTMEPEISDGKLIEDRPWWRFSSEIKEVVIGNGVRSISDWAFIGCGNVQRIDVGCGVTQIGEAVFHGCSSLEKVVFLGNPPTFDDMAFLNTSFKAYYPIGNTLWTEDVRQNYGGSILWLEGDGETSTCPHANTRTINEKSPGCGYDGYTGDIFCDDCQETIQYGDVIPGKPHDYTSWIVDTPPTVDGEGLEYRYCKCCGWMDFREIPALETPFQDVDTEAFYFDALKWAVENGITTGTSDTTFSPNAQCMRAHVVTFLWRAVGSPEPTVTDNPFVDVRPVDFYYKAVLWAVENGITNGVDATHFGATKYCNRAQVVTFLYRTMGRPEYTDTVNPFVDVAEDTWYYAPVLWAVANGITNGLSETTFGPNAICNRAQIVTFLYRAFVTE